MRKFLSLLMIALVLAMPMVTAQTLSVQQFSGADGVRNVAKTTDTLTVKALVTIPNDPQITPNQVRLITSEGISYNFETCAQQPGGALCTLTYALIGQGGEDTYTIAAFDDDNLEVKNAVEDLVNDFVNPEMDILYADKEILGQGSVTLSYRAEDYAFAPGDTDACAGVGSIKLYENTASAGYTGTIPGTTQVNDCTIEGEFQYTPRNTGEITICAIAFDRIGKTSAPLCTELNVDRSAPLLKSFRIAGFDGSTVFTIPPDGMSVSVEVVINDPSLDVNSIRADFTKLAGAQYADVGPNDIGTGTERTVIWYDIPLTSITPCEFNVKAADELGNTVNQKFTCRITSDTSAPEVIGMTTGFTSDDGTPLLGIQGDFQVRFDEQGLSRSNAFLDTQGLGLGTRRADYCLPDGQDWVCHWRLPANVNAARYTATVTTQTEDDLGNHLVSPSSFAFNYDPTPPAITGGPHVKAYHSNVDYGSRFVNSDTIEITYNVTGAVSAIANFSSIGGSDLSPGSCEANTCTFSQEIQRSGGYTETIPMKFLDEAGNFVETKYQITVHEVLDEQNPNYWKKTVTCTPGVLDRASTVLVNHQVYCKVKLTPHNSSKKVDVVATGLGPIEECTGDLQSSVAGLDLINNGYLSREPYLRVLLMTREYPEQQFNLTCPIHILTKVGDGFTSYPETENVTVQIKFGDSTMGSLAAGVDDKIEEAVDDVDKFGSWLDGLKKFFDYAEKICQLRQMFWNIAAALETIHIALSGISVATTFLGAPVEPGRQAWCQSKEQYVTFLGKEGQGLDSVLKPFCDFTNCNGFAGLDGLPDGNPITNFNYGGITSSQPTAGTPGSPGIINVKDSIVWSAATLCLPGIIYNIDKYRQIQCKYATCLKRDVKQSGVPISVCEDEKAYLTCTYFWGQAFAVIPYTAIAQYWINTVKEWIANPFAALAALIGAFCESQCGHSYGVVNIACSAAKVLEVVGKVIDDVNAVKGEEFFKVGQGSCQELEDLEDEA